MRYLDKPSLPLQGIHTVSVKDDLYGYKKGEFSWYRFSNLRSSDSLPVCSTLPDALHSRQWPSLVNFDDLFIFVIGGSSLSVDTSVYCIKAERWIEGPKLKQARQNNSSCRQGNLLYTFGGIGRAGKAQNLNSIERVNARLFTLGELNNWETIALPGTRTLPALQSPVFLSINVNELLILGGDFNHQRTGDGYLVNVRSGKVEQVV